MKILQFLALLTLSFVLESCSLMYDKVEITPPVQRQIQWTKEFGNDFLSTLNSGGHYVFGDEATKDIQTALTEDLQKSTYNKVYTELGDYEEIRFVEVCNKKNQPYLIYRFKCDFENGKDKTELRIVLDENDKIAGIWIKPWFDILI